MTEEEKQAIETVKQYKKCFVFETVHEETGERLNDYSNAIDIVLNLINKQQKEIEELNEIKQQICNEELITQDYVQDNFIAKDKIKEKIKELEENNKRIEKQFKGGSQNLLQNYIENIAQIKILKQLLEE